MRKLILRNSLSPGDIVMLTAAVRDLHRRHPGKFRTDVRTPCPALWENNPYVAPIDDAAPGVEVIDCEYPLIHESNHGPYHIIHGFAQDLGEKLGVEIRPTDFKGDIHLSDLEKRSGTSRRGWRARPSATIRTRCGQSQSRPTGRRWRRADSTGRWS